MIVYDLMSTCVCFVFICIIIQLYSLVPVFCKKQDEFLCGEGTVCLHISQVCDQVIDCPDSSDETKCRMFLLIASIYNSV